jgi:Glycosyltransferase like family
MSYQIVSVICGDARPVVPGARIRWTTQDGIVVEHFRNLARTLDNTSNTLSPCQAYQELLCTCNTDVIIYVHSDVTIRDPDWAARVMAPFEREEVVAVGLGGATGLGNSDLYRKPYNIWNLARRGYCSNQTDAEVHGARETGDRQVVVLDAFFMAVRAGWLKERGGWPVGHLSHHCQDLWLGCEAARAGKEIWMTGVSVLHSGGGTSTKSAYAHAPWLQGGTMESDHRLPHKWLYEEYRDVLPIEIKEKRMGLPGWSV